MRVQCWERPEEGDSSLEWEQFLCKRKGERDSWLQTAFYVMIHIKATLLFYSETGLHSLDWPQTHATKDVLKPPKVGAGNLSGVLYKTSMHL